MKKTVCLLCTVYLAMALICGWAYRYAGSITPVMRTPSGVTAQLDGDHVLLSWNMVGHASCYEIYVRPQGGEEWILLETVEPANLAFRHGGAAEEGLEYAVCAVNFAMGGEYRSELSDPAWAEPMFSEEVPG